MLVLIYVDDILITCSNHAAIHDLLTALHRDFAVKDLRSFNFFLGIIKVLPYSRGVLLSQQRYIFSNVLRCLKQNQSIHLWLPPLISLPLKETYLMILPYTEAQLEPYNTHALLD
jgi:hypothetical protein